MKHKITPDKQKSKSLKKMAKTTLERLENTDKLKYPANTLDDYYNVIHYLMEALACLNGIKFKGEKAHFELIEYISKILEFSELEKNFLQELRDFRNKISYEGLSIKKEYVERNQKNISKIINKLERKIEE
jgi:hypothetical protein